MADIIVTGGPLGPVVEIDGEKIRLSDFLFELTGDGLEAVILKTEDLSLAREMIETMFFYPNANAQIDTSDSAMVKLAQEVWEQEFETVPAS